MITVRSRQKVSWRDCEGKGMMPMVHISSVLTVVGNIPTCMAAAE